MIIGVLSGLAMAEAGRGVTRRVTEDLWVEVLDATEFWIDDRLHGSVVAIVFHQVVKGARERENRIPGSGRL